MKNLREIKDEIRKCKEAILHTCTNGDYLTGYISALSAVEGMLAELETGWIPVSERLPERNDFYDVTFELDCGVRLCQREYFDIENNRWLTPYNVIAWKERPEPYKG